MKLVVSGGAGVGVGGCVCVVVVVGSDGAGGASAQEPDQPLGVRSRFGRAAAEQPEPLRADL